ncbi:MAG: tRNA (N6-threonylcarbamoyladenosine(37)-N6)-methyltransferase TrmO [Dehalococcoidia bacterium]
MRSVTDALRGWLGRLVDSVRRAFGLGVPPVPREPVSLRPIGVVRNSVREPQPFGWEDVRSDVIVRDELSAALDGIEAYSHIIVVFSFHRVPDEARDVLRLRPMNDPRFPEQGVLATRSQRRPNGLGVAVVPLLRRRRNILRVRGLDAIDGTPVLDVKPYLPMYDSVADAQVPDWLLHPPEDASQ